MKTKKVIPVSKIVDIQNLKRALKILNAIDHNERSSILNWIDKNPDSNVTDIMGAFNIDQSIMSQHLAKLREAGFLYSEREGKFVKYKTAENAYKIIDAVKKFCVKS